jgi:hypothetical protein
MAKSWDEVDELLVKPLEEGYAHDGVTPRVAAEE